MNIDRTQLGKAIREIRLLREYTQAELAEKSGLKGNTIALIERGQRGVSLEALNALAEALAVPAACLTMLGTSSLKGESMQELIQTTILAQSQLAAKEKADRSVAASPKLRAIARKYAGTALRGKSRTAKKPAKSKRRKRLEPAR
jgi:transcriptional regulator with XRE-family HTH domain